MSHARKGPRGDFLGLIEVGRWALSEKVANRPCASFVARIGLRFGVILDVAVRLVAQQGERERRIPERR